MAVSESKKKLFNELSLVISNILGILDELGMDSAGYRGLKKVKNICSSFDMCGIKNIAGYLNGDFRIIHDNRVYDDNLERQINLAYTLADELAIN